MSGASDRSSSLTPLPSSPSPLIDMPDIKKLPPPTPKLVSDLSAHGDAASSEATRGGTPLVQVKKGLHQQVHVQ